MFTNGVEPFFRNLKLHAKIFYLKLLRRDNIRRQTKAFLPRMGENKNKQTKSVY